MTMKRAGWLLLLFGLVTGCRDETTPGDKGTADAAEEDRYGGTVVIGAIGDIPTVNPLTSTDHTANQVQMFVLFAPLIRYNEKFEPEPYAARSWDVNADTTLL